ncbi:type IV secretory pathway TrbD component [Microbacterium sp. AK009]|uniref:DUF6286 domain-containing protein n=1 Tax=Microbacterium sp. AK009 TaxID=2723068 RepID=UPI0015C77D49|nr:DUF6286 domain-containing protein [Microbacterium sp. AK009]NYF15399.1 type IV secretory pathway TrbD component [Microbacterium sp. AK009]
MTDRTLTRVVRRETHSPRTVAMFVAVILLILALIYVGVELVLSLLAQPALVAAPGLIAQWLVALPGDQPTPLVIVGGAILAVLGVVFVILAVTPGRLSKHELALDGSDRAVVVDNGVIAAAVAERISAETGVARDRVTVGVAHRIADVTVRPDPGVVLDRESVRRAATEEIDAYRLTPRVKVRARVEQSRQEGDFR